MSFSLGRKGFTINVGKHGVRRTVGIPGTGISNTEYITKTDADEEDDSREKKDEDEGLLGGMGTIAGMAAMGALAHEEERHHEDDEDKPKRRSRKTEKSPRKSPVRRTKAVKEEAKGQGYLALRGLLVLAAIAIAIYLGTTILPRLQPNWLSDLGHFLVQWAVQFGH
jgi:hypothetical protein